MWLRDPREAHYPRRSLYRRRGLLHRYRRRGAADPGTRQPGDRQRCPRSHHHPPAESLLRRRAWPPRRPSGVADASRRLIMDADPDHSSGPRILVVGAAWVGDMVMSQALFMALRKRQPECRITVLAPAWSRPLLARMPEI